MPHDPSRPVLRRVLAHWRERLEHGAGLARILGRGWPSVRRKFADAYDAIPPSQLMNRGGRESHKTIVETHRKRGEDKLMAAFA